MTRDTAGPLDFLTERDDQTGSWERSDPLHAVIRPHGGDTFDIKLPDGDYHDVRLHRDNGAWFGTCDCKGYEYGDTGEPCAHLCALRRAHWCAEHQPSDPAATDLYGTLVHVPTVDEIDDQPDTDPTPEARADGGTSQTAQAVRLELLRRKRTDDEDESIDELPTRCSGR